MKKKIWRIFNWHDGEYKYFLIKGGLPANLQLLPMNPASLIINGILHGYYPFELAEAELKKFADASFVVSPNGPYKTEDLGLNTQQSRFLAKFDGTGKTKEIINNSDLLHREAELLTYGLIITDILSPKGKTKPEGSAEETLRREAHEEYIEKETKDEAYAVAQKMDAELIFQKGKNHFTEGNYEKAAAEFEEIVRLNPAEAEYKAYLGWTLFSKDPKNIKRAKSLLMESLSSNPDLDVAHMFLARLYIKEGLFKEAEGGLTAALGKNPFLPEAWKERAFIKIRAFFDIRGKAYLDYFHLTKNPFDFLPEPDFFYQGDAHSEALHFLLNGIKSGKANVIILTGEKGSGKTSLCLKTMDALANEKIAFVYINSLNPPVSPFNKGGQEGDFDKGGMRGLGILIAIKNELGIKTSGDFSEDVISALHAHCSMCREVKGRTVVILDNAHKLNVNALRGIKTLLQTGIDNIIISAQPEVEHILNAPELKEINQAISGMHHLHPLSPEDTREYICKRLALAGSDGKLEITPWAFKTIHNASLGNPEMTNKICDLSLELAMKKATHTVDEQIVSAAEQSIGAELDERLPQLEPVEEKPVGLSEETVKKIVSEQVAEAVEEAVKREFEQRAAQFDIPLIVNKTMEDAVKIFEHKTQQIIEQRIDSAKDFGAGINETIEKTEKTFEEEIRQTSNEQIRVTDDNVGGQGFETGTVQQDTAFISFEADKNKSGTLAKSGLPVKFLMLAIAVAVITAAVANYDILQKIDIFLTSNTPQPPQVKSVALPKIEPPPVKIAPQAAEVQPAPEATQPVQKDKTSVEEGLKQEGISAKPRLLTLTFEVNGGRKETVFNGETFKVKTGDKIKIVSASAEGVLPKNITVNLLGFVSNKDDNTGEDRGYLIDTAKDLWKKHSTNGKGKEYPIVVKHKEEKIGIVVLKITD